MTPRDAADEAAERLATLHWGRVSVAGRELYAEPGEEAEPLRDRMRAAIATALREHTEATREALRRSEKRELEALAETDECRAEAIILRAQLEASRAVAWTQITDDPATWPKEGKCVLFTVGAGLQYVSEGFRAAVDRERWCLTAMSMLDAPRPMAWAPLPEAWVKP